MLVHGFPLDGRMWRPQAAALADIRRVLTPHLDGHGRRAGLPAGRTMDEIANSLAAWLDAHHPLSKADWVKLFRRTFVFTGGEIVGEFLMSLGYLPGAHVESCPIYSKVMALHPPWAVKA